MGIVYIYVALASYNVGYLTLPMGSVENIVDEAANVAVVDAKGRMIVAKRGRKGERGVGGGGRGAQGKVGAGGTLDWRALWSEGTDAVMDVPVGGVCEILYGEGRESDGNDSVDSVVT